MIDASKLLSGIPDSLRNPLLQSYQAIVTNYIEHRWEPAELNGGKFCEVVFTILDGSISGIFASKPSKPRDMVTACRGLESKPSNQSLIGDESLRVLIPKILLPLYEIRNKRGVGHAGGDVDPNYLDATAVYGMSSWILAELIRIFHKVSAQEAHEVVSVIIERKCSLIWEIDGVRRVLDPTMSAKDKALVLLYGLPSWVSEKDLCSWVEYSSIGMFRQRALKPLHDKKLIEHDKKNARVHISPLGVKDVEQRLLKSFQ